MKIYFYTIAVLYLLSGIAFGQNQAKQDPFFGHRKLGSSDELSLIWHSGSNIHLKHQIYTYGSNNGASRLDSSAVAIDTNTAVSGRKRIDAVTGDFTGSGLDNIVFAEEGVNNSIKIIVPEIEKNTLNWTGEKVFTLPNVLFSNPLNYKAVRFRLIKGYFDESQTPEIAVAYWNKDATVQITVLKIDPSTLMPSVMATISDVYLDSTSYSSGIYDIAAGDFNGNGRDEIVLVTYSSSNSSSNSWNISAKIYDFVNNNGTYSIVPKVNKSDFFTSSNFFDPYHTVNEIDIAAGNFNSKTIADQFVVDFVLQRSGSETYDYLLPASVTTGLDTINVNYNNLHEVRQTLGTSIMPINIKTGDITHNGNDEIVTYAGGAISIFSVGDTMNLNGGDVNYVSIPELPVHTDLVLADLNASPTDSVWTPEIACMSAIEWQPDSGPWYSTFSINVFEPVVDANGDITSVNKRASITVDSVVSNNTEYYWALTAGDFNGKSIRLGDPTYYHVTNIVQPLVILNAPPTHFDVFNDTSYDISNSYNGQTSNFYSDYFTTTQTDFQMQTELHTGWSVGGSASGTFVIPELEIPVTAKVNADYGHNFSKVSSSSQSFTIKQSTRASNDDYIYAMVVDYDIWEYPVYANNALEGYTLVTSPKLQQRDWFPSKSPEGDTYIPNHEVGNILSYKQITNPSDNTSLSQAIRWSTSDAVTLDVNSGAGYDWSLEKQTSNQTTTTNEVKFDAGASLGFEIPIPFIPNFEIHGNYSHDSISTFTNTVTYSQGLDVHLGPINPSIPGGGYYTVTPYAYWARDGALVLDYAVNPGAAGANEPETWWQQRYAHASDPALILPWRLDNDKGYNYSADKLQQTKEMIFNPDNPSAGDTVNIQVRIHNYSLIPTPRPVEAKFYAGDPANGGILIQSMDGKSVFSTSDFIPARGSKIISFNWKIPAETPNNPRIYVVLDPNNSFPEIHKSNNIGWKVLNYTGSATGIKTEPNIPVAFHLSQNYPNPFNPTTTIEYSIPQPEFVTIKVYDILGREVKTLVNRQMQKGSYKLNFDGSGLASGIYFYRIKSGSFIQTKKAVLLK